MFRNWDTKRREQRGVTAQLVQACFDRIDKRPVHNASSRLKNDSDLLSLGSTSEPRSIISISPSSFFDRSVVCVFMFVQVKQDYG